jgi:hypothetical protein
LEQREPTCLHDWSSRDKNQHLLIVSAKIRKSGELSVPLPVVLICFVK